MSITLFARARRLLFWLLVLLAPAVDAMTLGISLNPDRVRPGEALLATITVTNDSAVTVTAVQLQAQMPASGVNSIGQSYASGAAVCPGTGCDPSEFIVWNLGILAPGRGVTVSMPMVVSSGAVSGSVITMPAKLLVGGVQVLSASQSVVVNNLNALSLAVDADKDDVAPGGRLTYDLSYGNRSAASVTGSTLSLPLPAGVTLVSASGGGTLVAGSVTWNLNTLQAGQSGRQQVVVNTGSALASGSLLSVNAALLAGDSVLTGPDTARTTLITRVQSNPVLGLAITMNADPIRPSEVLGAVLTVSNNSDATVFGAVLAARWPLEGANSLGQSYLSGGAVCPGTGCDPFELVTWNFGTMAPRSALSFSVPIGIYSGFESGRQLSLEAAAQADGIAMTHARHSVAVDADNALSLALDTDKNGVIPGELLTYSLSYGNRNTSSVTGTTLSLPLPDGLTFVAASGGGSLSGSTVNWALNTLQAGQSGRQQVIVRASAALASGSTLVVDAAQLAGTSAVTGPELARATQVTRVQSDPVLGVAIAMNGDPMRPSEVLDATVTVTNRSDATVFGAVLQARWPSEGANSLGQTYLTGGATCPGTGCDPSELVTWNVGTMAPRSSVTYSVPMRSIPVMAPVACWAWRPSSRPMVCPW